MSGRLSYKNKGPYGEDLDETPIIVECLENECAWWIKDIDSMGNMVACCAVLYLTKGVK